MGDFSQATQLPDATLAEQDPRQTIRGDASTTATLRLPELTVAESGAPAFQLGEVLGSGSMGVVRLATQAGLGRAVALKHLHRDASTAESQALLAEAGIMGRLEHPVIVPVHAVGMAPELGPVVVMKRIEGRPWSEVLAEADVSDPDVLSDQIQTLIRVCDGVHFAHTRGVIHRDLKPENVMLGGYGEIYVVDWGVALDLEADTSDTAADQPHRIVGTPAYMAPEMADGSLGPPSPRSDVFLLGAMLIDVLFGHPPHRAESVIGCLVSATRPITLPDDAEARAPRELVEVCRRACAFAPEDRYASVAELQAALREFLRHQDAQRLVDGVVQRLEALEREPVTVKTAAEVERRATELSAAFGQALELDDGSARALEGQRRCRLVMLRGALARESLEEAERLATGVDELPPDVARALEALRARRAAQEEAERLLQEQARRRDVRVGVRYRRRIALLLFGVVAAIVTIDFIARPRAELPPMRNHALHMTGVFALWLVLLVRGRRHFFATEPNKLFAYGCTSLLFGMFVGRWIAVAAQVPATKGAFTELVLFMVVAIQLSQLHRGFWINFALAFGGAGALLLAPGHTRLVMTFVVLCQPIVAWYVWRGLRDADEPG